MSLPVAGLLNSGAGLVTGLYSDSVLVQFQDDSRNTLVEFDAVITDGYRQQTAPTAYPVEDGQTVSDHITRLPLTFELTGYISDNPLGKKSDVDAILSGNLSASNPLLREGVTTAASALLPPLGVVAASTAASLFIAKGSKPSVSVFNKLRVMQLGANDGTPPVLFTVVSRLGRFDHMAIGELGVPRDADTGEGLLFQMTLVQVRIVAAQQVPLSALDAPTLAAAKQGLGAQAPQTGDDIKTPESFDENVFQNNLVKGYRDEQSVTQGVFH